MASTWLTEFAPAPTGKKARVVLGAVLTALTCGAALLAASVVLLPRVLEYEIGGGILTIRTGPRVWPRAQRFALADISDAHPVRLQGGRRTAGTALPGYCVGRFSYPQIGRVWQATSCGADAVLLRLRPDGRPVVLSPARWEEFLATLAAGGRGRFDPPATAKPPSWLWVTLAMLLALLLSVLVPALLFLAPARLRYRVGEGRLEVQTLFLRKRFPLVGASVRRCSGRLGLKLTGSSMPGHYAGWFLLDGSRTRVYASKTDDGVLLENSTRVFVSPADVDGFLAAVRREGARTT